MRNFCLTLCYDGTRYRGWQRQGNTGATIQGKVEAVLSRTLAQPVEAAASGRTDAGVHAREQVVSFRGETELSCGEILQALRDYLPEDIGAVALTEEPPRFHARLSCREKTYLYRVWNSPAPCVFQRRYVCRWPEPLDTAAMEAAGARLCGKHDFAAFCTAAGKKRSTVRTLREIRILRQGEELRLFFTGDGFLYNMVRILAGTLLEVGAGRLAPEDMPDILAGRDRKRAGPTLPAQGLCLWRVRYGYGTDPAEAPEEDGPPLF